MKKQIGWKPIPLSLKIISVLTILWILGSISQLSVRYEQGLPFFGLFLYGIIASLIVLLLDIIGPILFLYGLWNRKNWAPKIAFIYLGIFILNSIVALFTVSAILGFMPILVPLIVNSIFLLFIYIKLDYFK